jgi:hypothetical protein
VAKRREATGSSQCAGVAGAACRHADVLSGSNRARGAGQNQFWNDSQTTVRERKRAVRFLIEDVTVHKTDQIVAHIRFKGGATQTINVPLPPPFAQSRLTAPSRLAAIDRLLDEYTDAQVAEHLNQQGYRTFDGLLFHSMHVSQLRHHHGLADRSTHLRAQGLLTAEELAHSYRVTANDLALVSPGAHCWCALQ